MLQTDLSDRSDLLVYTYSPDIGEFDKQSDRLIKTLTGYCTDLHKSQLATLRSVMLSNVPCGIHHLFTIIDKKISVVDSVSSANERNFIHETLQKYGYKTGRKSRDIRPK